MTTARGRGPPARRADDAARRRPARRVVIATTVDDVVRTALLAWADDEPLLVLGGGSNVVIGDDGLRRHRARRRDARHRAPAGRRRTPPAGLPRAPRTASGALERSLRPAQQREEVRVRVQAGSRGTTLCAEAVRQGWSGIEALSGVPGSDRRRADPEHRRVRPGGRGDARGRRVPRPRHGHVRRLPASELRLGYRTSVFKQGLSGRRARGRAACCTARSATGRSLGSPVAYAQLADALGVPLGGRVPIAALRDTRARAAPRRRGWCSTTRDPESVSVGSFFTNPIVTERFARSLPARRAAVAHLRRRARRRGAARRRAAAAPAARRRAAGQAVRGMADRARRRRSAGSASPGSTRTSRASTRSRS